MHCGYDFEGRIVSKKNDVIGLVISGSFDLIIEVQTLCADYLVFE